MLYALTTFLSAFLLFQIQPMVARAILPWFGGSATLWTVAVLFFQFGLLAAYAYAHFVLRALSPSRQKILHVVVVLLSLLTLPVTPSGAFDPTGEPALRILVVLFRTVAVPYFVVAATAPLLQGWYAQESDSIGHRVGLPSPYVLYAVSNTGSLLALLSYPFAIEPVLGLRAQFESWSVAYGGFAAALALLAWASGRGARARAAVLPGSRGAASGDQVVEPPPASLGLVSALGLTAATNTLLLAVTTTLSHNIAPVPLLWVVPLALYLLSFALPFGVEMRRLRLFLPFVAVLALGPIVYAVTTSRTMALPARLGLLMPAFFTVCLACHVELAHLKPHPRYLSSFYLMIALGGTLGGIFAGILSPLLFDTYHELPLSLAASAILAVCLFARGRGWSWRHPMVVAPVAAAVAAGVYMAHVSIEDLAGDRLATRNFYGTLEVTDDATDDMGPFRLLVNGRIRHGGQLLDPAHRRDPTTYYGPDSGAGLAIRAAEQGGPVRVGVIGLGAGTLACYGRAGDRYVFYEINPLVVRLASTEFSFLRDSPAKIEIVQGDGRLSLERRDGPPFDVLVVDAFSGDSIPVHLLTREAFALYFRRLAPAGILALHISNKYVDLEPVVSAAARALGKQGVVVSADDEDFPLYDSTWVLLSSRADRFKAPAFEDAEPLTATPVAWTDDYSNLLSVLKR